MPTVRIDVCGGARDGKSALIASLGAGLTGGTPFTVVEAANDEQYTRNLAARTPVADVSVIVVDARQGVSAATRRHGFFAALLAVRHVVLAVNKMDLVAEPQATFTRIDDEFRKLAAQLGLRTSTACRSRRRTATTSASAPPRCPGTRGPPSPSCSPRCSPSRRGSASSRCACRSAR